MTANVLILAAGMLVSVYLMVGQKALFTTIRLYGLESLLLAIVATTMAISEPRPVVRHGSLTVVLKTILIPGSSCGRWTASEFTVTIEPIPERPCLSADPSRPDRGRVPGQHGL